MKKLLLGLGTLASVAAPIAAVIACGSTPETTQYKVVESGSVQETALAVLTTEVTTKALTLAPGAILKSTEIKGDDVRYTFSPVVAPADEASDDSTADATHTGVRITLNIKSGLATKLETADDAAGSVFKDNATELTAVKDAFKVQLQAVGFKFKANELTVPEFKETKAKAGATAEYAAVGTAEQDRKAAYENIDGETALNAYKAALAKLSDAITAYNNKGTSTAGPSTAGAVTNPGGDTTPAKPTAVVTKDLSLDDKALLDGKEFKAQKNDVLPSDASKVTADLKDFIDGTLPEAVTGVTRTYSAKLTLPGEVVVTVTSTETASTARVSTSTFTIKGFIAAQALVQEIQNYLLAPVGGTKVATDPIIAPDKAVDADASLIPTTAFDLDDLSPAENITLSNAIADTSTGSISADYSADLRGEVITGTVKFTGWKSALSPEALAQKAVADLKTEFEHLTATDLTTSESAELPSTHASDKTLSALGISHIPTTSSKDTITYALTPKDTTGKMEVVATIANGATTDTASFTITGFQTTAEHDEVVALKAAQATIVTTTIDAPVAAITGAASDGSTEYATAKTAYDNAKTAAQAATTSTAVKAEVDKMKTAKTAAAAANTKQTAANTKQTAANTAAKTAADLKAEKAKAIKAITDVTKGITSDAAAHDATKFGAIKTAEDAAKTAINATSTVADAKSKGAAELRKVQAAITAYTSSDGTDAVAAAATKAAQAKIDGVTKANLVAALRVATGVKAKDAVKTNVTGTISGVKLTVKSVTRNANADATDVVVVVTVSSSDTGTTSKDLTVTVKFEANPSAVVTKTKDDVAGLVTFGSANGKATLKAKPAWLNTLVFDGAVINLKDTDKVTVNVTYATGFTGPKTVKVQVKAGTEKAATPTPTNADILTALATFIKGDPATKAHVKAAIAKLGFDGHDVKVTIGDESNLSNGDKVVVTISGAAQEFDLTAGKWTAK